MENDKVEFPPDRERLEYIERTVREHSAQEVDIQRIVVNAMNAYWEPRIKESISPDVESTTALLLRRAAYFLETRADNLNALLAVLVPSLVYLIIVYVLVSQRGDWGTPISGIVVFLAVSLPIALAIALVIVSRQQHRLLFLGVLRNTVGGFMTNVSTGAACGGLILAAVTTWALIYIVDARRENRAITFNYAKSSLVDRSLSTVKDLQAFPDTRIENKTTELPVTANNVLSLRSEPGTSKSGRGGKYFIEDQGAFPGQLSAEIDSSSATVFWQEEGKSEVAQTKIYVCTVTSISGGKVFVEAIGPTVSSSSDKTPESKGGSETEAATNKSNDSVIGAISLEVSGTNIELTFNPQLMNVHDFSKGQTLIVAYDPKTRVASRIEPIFVSAALRVGTPNLNR